MLGVIEPGAAAARAASQSGDVFVVATEATVHSRAYTAACSAHGLRTIEKACPLLVPLVLILSLVAAVRRNREKPSSIREMTRGASERHLGVNGDRRSTHSWDGKQPELCFARCV